MKLDISKFRRVKGNVLQHPNGHKIILDKKGLDKGHLKQLEAIPMADGGEIDDEDEAPAVLAEMPEYDPQAAAYNILTDPNASPLEKEAIAKKRGLPTENVMGESNIANLLPQTGGRIPVDMPSTNISQEQPTEVSSKAPEAKPVVPMGLNQMQQGIRNEAAAQGNLGKQQAEIIANSVSQQQKDLENYQNITKQMTNEYRAFRDDLQKQHVDPNQYWNKMGAGQKISTAIGMLLGGLNPSGSNQVIKMIDDDINRDISAQKDEISKKDTLFRGNMEQFRNQYQAAAMTKAMHLEMFNSQLQKAAADSQDPIAKARAQQLGGQIQMKIDEQLQQGAAQKAMMDRLSSQSPASQGNPSQTILGMQRSGVMSKDEAKEAFKEAKEAAELMKGRDNALKAFDEMNKMNTIGSRLTSPLQSGRRADAIRDNLAVQLARDAAGRVNEYEFKAAKNLFPAPGDDEKTVQEKRRSLIDFVNKKANFPYLNSFGINPSGGLYNEHGQKSIQESAPKL